VGLLVRCLENVPEMGVTSDINTVINVYNCDTCTRTSAGICENFPFIATSCGTTWTPTAIGRGESDCIPRHYEFQCR